MDVDAVLAARQGQYKSAEVEKDVEPQYDLGNLLVTDLSSVETEDLRRRKEEYLREAARANTQLLINKIWELPTEKVDGLVLAELPEPTTALPREKRIPKPKPPTKWELYAKQKGILKKKRPRMMFDDKAQEWKPRWGYKRVDDLKDQWVVEVPENADPYDDHFEKKVEERRERVAKNEFQRLRNIKRAQKGGIKLPLPPAHTKDLSKHQLTQAMGLAKTATASGGTFTESLAKEPKPKKVKKTKFGPVVGDFGSERARNLDLLKKIGKKKPIMDVAKATNKQMADDEKRISRKRKAGDLGGKPRTKRSKSGGKPQRNSAASSRMRGGGRGRGRGRDGGSRGGRGRDGGSRGEGERSGGGRGGGGRGGRGGRMKGGTKGSGGKYRS